MKRITNSIALIAVFAVVFASCSKVAENPIKDNPEENGKTINISINASYGDLTKTHIDGTDVKWDSSGEFLKVLQEKDGDVTDATSSQGVTTDGGATMTFAVSFSEATGTEFNYYAFYPASALQGDNPGVNDAKINTPAAQTPTETSFDPAADLLIAKKVANGNTQAINLSMQFTRAVAVGKMTITNLQTSDPVKKIVFSAQDGGEDVKLAGRTTFNLETAAPVSSYASNVVEKSIILDYSSLSLTANVSMDAFFTCYPFSLAAGDSFTVAVQTASKTYTRTVTLTGDQVLSFVVGKASRFSVDMSGAAESNNAVDLRYACLTSAEYNAAGGTNSYNNVTVSKPHGDKWETYAMYNSSSIQIRNSNNPGSFVKLPVFTENIKTVIVTLSSAIAADKKLTLETTSDGTEGSVLSLSTVADQTIYSFDLTSKTVKTAFLRSVGAAAYVAKIEVFAGEDNRAKLSAPTGVTATLNGTNNIDVAWTKVGSAIGYEITCAPSSGVPVVNVVGDVSSFKVEGLANNTTFTVSVASLPDLYVNTKSDPANAESTVTTLQGATVATINFGSASGSTAINNTEVTGEDSQNNTWTITSVMSQTSFTQNSAYSQIGSSSKPATSITFTTTLPSSKAIKEMSAKFGGFSGTAGTVTLKVGDTVIGTGSLNATSDVIVEANDKTQSGTVLTVTVTGISKGVKAYYISVTYQ